MGSSLQPVPWIMSLPQYVQMDTAVNLRLLLSCVVVSWVDVSCAMSPLFSLRTVGRGWVVTELFDFVRVVPCSLFRALGSVLLVRCSWFGALGSVFRRPRSVCRVPGSVLPCLLSLPNGSIES